MTQNEVNYLFFIALMLLFGIVWAFLQYKKTQKEEEKLMMRYLNAVNPFNRFRGNK